MRLVSQIKLYTPLWKIVERYNFLGAISSIQIENIDWRQLEAELTKLDVIMKEEDDV